MKDLHTPLQLLVQFMNLCEDQVDYSVPIFFFFTKVAFNQNIPPAINTEATGKNKNWI